MYNEADTRAKLIDRKFHAAGWDEERIKRDHYFTKGQVYIADYLLRYNARLPLAVVEAKAEVLAPAVGLEQAKTYAQQFGLLFAYSTNGHGIEEFDFSTNVQKSLTKFPSPEALYQRYLATTPPITDSVAHADDQPSYYAAWSDWVNKGRFDDIADLAEKKAWYFKTKLKDSVTGSALGALASAAKKQDVVATLEGLKLWAHLIDNQARWEAAH